MTKGDKLTWCSAT